MPAGFARLLVNALIFNAVWFVCVAWRMPWAAVACAVALTIHILWIRPGDWRMPALAAVIGTGVDTALSLSGVFVFDDSHWRIAFLCPLWLTLLWVAFGTTVPVSLAFLDARPWLQAVVGAVAGPFAYAMGGALGAVEFGYPFTASIIVLAVVWAGLLPLLFACSRWIDAKGGN